MKPFLSMMSGPESFIFLLCTIEALWIWGAWYWMIFRHKGQPYCRGGRGILVGVPIACGLLLYFVLAHWAAQDVRNDPGLVLMYLAFGAAWTGLSVLLLDWLGLNVREDVIERGNAAAAVAIGGALVGFTLSFAGANIGNGPGWWAVLFGAALSTVSLFIFWLALGHWGGLAESITVDRDPAMGWRAGGFFVGAGLIMGRALAGNWVSARATLVDFTLQGWGPVLALAVLVLVMQHNTPPNTERGFRSTLLAGIVPGILYAAFGIAVVWIMGKW